MIGEAHADAEHTAVLIDISIIECAVADRSMLAWIW